jgi:hypothetical protein
VKFHRGSSNADLCMYMNYIYLISFLLFKEYFDLNRTKLTVAKMLIHLISAEMSIHDDTKGKKMLLRCIGRQSLFLSFFFPATSSIVVIFSSF